MNNENITAAERTIGEANGESCSRCGRANTWHPDCPTCRRLEMLKTKLAELQAEYHARIEAAFREGCMIADYDLKDSMKEAWLASQARAQIQTERGENQGASE